MALRRFCSGGGARRRLAGRFGLKRIFGKGYGRHHQRLAGAALCQPQIRSCECQGRSDQGQRRRLGLYPLGPAGRNHRRIRELAPGARFRRRRGLGLSLAAVGPPHRGRHHEEQGRSRAALRSRRSNQRGRRPPAGRRRGPGQALRGRLVPLSAATASTAGSNSSGCGASTPTRRWIEFFRPENRLPAFRQAGIHTARLRRCGARGQTPSSNHQ